MRFSAAERTWSILENALDTSDAVRNIPLGILELADYEQFDIELEPGDLILCYTDALIESKNPAGEFLGENGLLELIKLLPTNEPRKFIDALLAKIASLHLKNLMDDDVTVLLLRPSLAPRVATLLEKIRAIPKAIGEALRHPGRLPLPDFSLANLGGAIFPALSRRWREMQNPLKNLLHRLLRGFALSWVPIFRTGLGSLLGMFQHEAEHIQGGDRAAVRHFVHPAMLQPVRRWASSRLSPSGRDRASTSLASMRFSMAFRSVSAWWAIADLLAPYRRGLLRETYGDKISQHEADSGKNKRSKRPLPNKRRGALIPFTGLRS